MFKMFERIVRTKLDFSGMPSRLQIYQKSNFVYNFLICNTAATNNSTNFLQSAGMESSTKASKKKKNEVHIRYRTSTTFVKKKKKKKRYRTKISLWVLLKKNKMSLFLPCPSPSHLSLHLRWLARCWDNWDTHCILKELKWNFHHKLFFNN